MPTDLRDIMLSAFNSESTLPILFVSTKNTQSQKYCQCVSYRLPKVFLFVCRLAAVETREQVVTAPGTGTTFRSGNSVDTSVTVWHQWCYYSTHHTGQYTQPGYITVPVPCNIMLEYFRMVTSKSKKPREQDSDSDENDVLFPRNKLKGCWLIKDFYT